MSTPPSNDASPLVVVHRWPLAELCDLVKTAIAELRDAGSELAESLEAKLQTVTPLSMPAPNPVRLSATQAEADWVAARVNELWHDPMRVSDALERLFSDGCSRDPRWAPRWFQAHTAARLLRQDDGIALCLHLKATVNARLVDVALDEWDELPESPRSPARPLPPDARAGERGTSLSASPLADSAESTDHSVGSAELSSQAAA